MAIVAADLANRALTLIGAAPITATDITNDTLGSTASVFNDVYSELRDELLRGHPWNFATKRAQLSQSATTPAFEFDYGYTFPSDWLRTISVHDNNAGYGTLFYKDEVVVVTSTPTRMILANSSQVYMRYVYQVTDPDAMAPDFRAALVSALARDMSIKLTNSNKIFDSLSVRAARDLAKARSIDAMGAFPELRPRGSWASSRAGRGDQFFSD